MRILRVISPIMCVAVAFLAAAPLSAQDPGGAATGRIVGRVVDAGQGAPIVGAQLEVVDAPTPVTGTSALDGRFTLDRVPAGPVSVRVRMIGYQPKLITGVAVPAGQTMQQNVSLTTEVVQLAEIQVSAESERGTVNRALEEQRHANNIVSAVTGEQIERSPDGDAAEAIQRVSGVTVQDGKYIFVRGLGERYTTASLNGARIPSPEPERKVVPLDLFPSGLLEAITTSKTFTPDQPGDFSGAQVNLKTREFPARKVFTLSLSGGFNDRATFQDVLVAPTTGREWLGFGGSERQLPDAVLEAGNLGGLTQTEVNQLIGSFRNSWSAQSGNGAPEAGFGMSLGGEDKLFGGPFGYLLSLNYSYNQEIRSEEQRGLAAGDTLQTVPFNPYHGETGRRTVLWGGLANFTSRLGQHTRLNFNNALTRSADNEATVLVGENEEFSHFNPFHITRLTFVERSMRSNQVQGEHLLGSRSLVDWSATNAQVTRNEPDRSDVTYQGASGSGVAGVVPATWPGQPRFATRTFTDLTENSWDFAGNYRLAIGKLSNPAFVKFGGAFRTTNRESNTRAYDIINIGLTDAQRTSTPESVFEDSNVNASAFTLFANANGGRYDADEQISAGYLMADIPVAPWLQLIAGARVEYWNLDLLTISTQGLPTPADRQQTDVLPSLALNFFLTPTQNLRLSASQTLSRPQFRELSPVPYFEQIGLLTTFGNPELDRALIRNLDARWEWYPRPGEVLSLGVFYKNFDDPIEKIIRLQAGTQALTFVNADRAENYGVELEVRKNLASFGKEAGGLSAFANTTLMRSDITPGNTGISALSRDNRPMVGQSEYVVNGGLTFATDGGFSSTALYNVVGRRILEAGTGGLPDAYEEARHLIDVALQIPVGQHLGVKLEAKNLLDSPYRLTQGDVLRQRWKLGRSFCFSFSWQP
jgi:hypothetical protein